MGQAKNTVRHVGDTCSQSSNRTFPIYFNQKESKLIFAELCLTTALTLWVL
jgi:hypothetical protein